MNWIHCIVILNQCNVRFRQCKVHLLQCNQRLPQCNDVLNYSTINFFTITKFPILVVTIFNPLPKLFAGAEISVSSHFF